MATLTNSFEGLADGDTITTGNSGGASGDPFTLAGDTAGGTCTASTVWAAHGTVSMAFTLGATAGPERRGYEVNAANTAATQYFRFYLNPAQCVGAISPLRGMGVGSSAQRFRIGYNANTRIVTLHNNGNTEVWASTALTAGADHRVELAIGGSTSTTAQVRIFEGHGASPVQDSGSVAINSGGPIREVWWGQTNATGNVSGKLDALGWSDTDWLGPAAASEETAEGTGAAAGVAAAVGSGVALRPGSGVAGQAAAAVSAGVAVRAGTGAAAGVAAAGSAGVSVRSGFGSGAAVSAVPTAGLPLRSGTGAAAVGVDVSGSGWPVRAGSAAVESFATATGAGFPLRAGSGPATAAAVADGHGSVVRFGAGVAVATAAVVVTHTMVRIGAGSAVAAASATGAGSTPDAQTTPGVLTPGSIRPALTSDGDRPTLTAASSRG